MIWSSEFAGLRLGFSGDIWEFSAVAGLPASTVQSVDCLSTLPTNLPHATVTLPVWSVYVVEAVKIWPLTASVGKWPCSLRGGLMHGLDTWFQLPGRHHARSSPTGVWPHTTITIWTHHQHQISLINKSFHYRLTTDWLKSGSCYQVINESLVNRV